jgi:hypothetical protein
MGRREGRAPDEVVSCCAQAALRIGRGANPVGKEAVPPWSKSKIPPWDPPFLASHRCRSRASTRTFFAVVFDRSLRVTAPLPLCATARGRLSLLVVRSTQDNCLSCRKGVVCAQPLLLEISGRALAAIGRFAGSDAKSQRPPPPFRTIQVYAKDLRALPGHADRAVSWHGGFRG